MLTIIVAVVALVIGYFIGRWDVSRTFEEWHPHGPHEHVCACGNAWQHDGNNLTMGEIQSAHECSKCGATVMEIAKFL